VKHSIPEFREIAERGTILRCQVGSGVHGTAIEGYDDRDEMGICVEPPEYVIGLKRFEQYMYRTKPEGVRSGPGDLDLTIYSLRKWLRLALQVNSSWLPPHPDRWHADRWLIRAYQQVWRGDTASLRKRH
jgi:predicted nucleotidyltransferase